MAAVVVEVVGVAVVVVAAEAMVFHSSPLNWIDVLMALVKILAIWLKMKET